MDLLPLRNRLLRLLLRRLMLLLGLGMTLLYHILPGDLHRLLLRHGLLLELRLCLLRRRLLGLLLRLLLLLLLLGLSGRCPIEIGGWSRHSAVRGRGLQASTRGSDPKHIEEGTPTVRPTKNQGGELRRPTGQRQAARQPKSTARASNNRPCKQH